MTPRPPYPFAAPRFPMLLRGAALWVNFAADGNGGAVVWIDQEPDPPLDDCERRRIDQRAAEELLQRQAWWREQSEAKRLRRRVAAIAEAGRRL